MNNCKLNFFYIHKKIISNYTREINKYSLFLSYCILLLTTSYVWCSNLAVEIICTNKPPAAISNLTALTGPGEGEITLQWTAPGLSEIYGTATGYLVKFATAQIRSADFYASWVSTYSQSWTPLEAGSNESRVLTGFTIGTTYYFAIKAYNFEGKYGVWNSSLDVTGINSLNFAFAVSIAPAAITDLVSLPSKTSATELILVWTAPGDDGSLNNIVGGQYRIEYTSNPTANWGDSSNFYIQWTTNTSPGNRERRIITGLTPEVTYYFWIRTADEIPIWSDISNKATGYAGIYGIYTETYPGIKHDILNPPDTDGGWTGTWNSGAYSITLTDDTGEYTEGTKSRKAEVTGSGDGGAGWWTQFGYNGGTNPKVPTSMVAYSSNSTLCFDVKTNGEIIVKVEWDLPGGGDDAAIEKDLGAELGIPLDNTWRTVLVNFKTIGWNDPEGQVIDFSTITVPAGFHAKWGGGAVTYYVDNLRWVSTDIENIPPAPTTTLSASPGPGGLQISLTWIAPGDDNRLVDINNGTYRIRYSTYITAASDFWTTGTWNDLQNKYEINWTTNTSVGINQTGILTGLREAVTYYIRLWTADEKNNWSNISNGATTWAYYEPPGAITNLSALTGRYGRTIDLSWTAPGDDGYLGELLSGSKYAIQRSTWSGVVWSTYSVDTIVFSTSGVNPGEWQFSTLTGLTPGVTYYIRIWTSDENSFWSDISNGATAYAQIVILSIDLLEPNTWYSFGTLPTGASTSSVSGIIVRNDGNVRETYLLRITTGAPYTIWNSSTIAGNNQFVLYSIGRASQPAIGSFGESEGDDILTLSNITASDSNFTVNGETPIAVRREPYTIQPILADCTFWFKLNTPLATSTTAEQTIPTIFTATEAD